MKTIRDIVKDAGRLETITNIVLKISTRNSYDLPIRGAVDIKSGESIFRVKTDDIRKGIRAWDKYLDTDAKNIDTNDTEDLEWFSMYVESELEVLLHNYANSCAHRNIPPEEDLEIIRAWEILNSTLNYMLFENRCTYSDNNNPDDFTIPEGWKVKA